MKKANEENAAKAFCLILKAITRSDYEKIKSPDEVNRRSRDVDYIFGSIDSRRRQIAAEHTILESFQGQIGYANKSFDIVADINKLCQGKIPKDRYFSLAVPHVLVESLDRPGRKQFVATISPVIAESCQQLKIDDYVKIKHCGHELWLMCGGTHPEMNGNLGRLQKRPEDHERLQRERFGRSLIEKLPKLVKYKVRGYETALLIEDVAGSLIGTGQRDKMMSIYQRIIVRLIVDYIIIFASVEGRMVVGNVWKEKLRWYDLIPYPRRFSFRTLENGNITLED